MTESLADIARRQQSDDRRSDDPLLDAAIAELLRLAEEVCVLEDRLDTVRRLAADGTTVSDAAIDAYQPDAAAAAERLARHTAFYEDVFARMDRRDGAT